MIVAPERIAQIVNSTCPQCLDTGIALAPGTPVRCGLCPPDEKQFSVAAVRLSVRLWVLLDRTSVDLNALKLARLLTHTTFESPIRGKLLRAYFGFTARHLKSLIENLRGSWALPIGSFREPPYGYYWMRSPEEFNHWLRTMRAQAMTELTTGYRLYRAVYPELAGQEALDFAEDFSRDLQEAII